MAKMKIPNMRPGSIPFKDIFREHERVVLITLLITSDDFVLTERPGRMFIVSNSAAKIMFDDHKGPGDLYSISSLPGDVVDVSGPNGTRLNVIVKEGGTKSGMAALMKWVDEASVPLMGAREVLRDRAGSVAERKVIRSTQGTKLSTVMQVVQKIKPMTHVRIKIDGNLPDSTSVTKMVMDKTFASLREAGFESVHDRLYDAAIDIESLYAFVILASTYVTFEADCEEEDEVDLLEPAIITVITGGNDTSYCINSVAYASKMMAIGAGKQEGKGLMPIIVEKTADGFRYEVDLNTFESAEEAREYSFALNTVDMVKERNSKKNAYEAGRY